MSSITSNSIEDYENIEEIFINIIVGLLMGLIGGYFLTKNVIKKNVSHGPDSQKMKTVVHKIGEKYYKFIPYPVIGPIRK